MTPADAHRDGRVTLRRLLVVIATVGLIVAPTIPALGDEDAGDAQPAEVTKTAYWTNSPGEALPGILYNRFPPQVVCLVIPETCTQQVEQITGPINDAKPAKSAYPNPPFQPVAPETLPVARFGGVERYVSAMHFELPPTPEGMEIDRFILVLTEAQPSFSMDSPAFRQFALATMASIQAGQPLVGEYAKVLTEADEYPLMDESFLGDNVLEVEACALLVDFEEGDSQSWDEIPARECVFGDTGTRSEDGIWTFDLTLAAQAWDGSGFEELENFGIGFGPLRSQNVAWGDPDLSDNAQISFAGPESSDPPMIIVEYREAFDDTFTAPPGDTGDSGFGGGDFDGGAFTSAPPRADAFAPPSDGPGDVEPVVADDAAAAPSQQPVAAAQAMSPVGSAQTPFYVWMLLPAALAAMYAMGRVLTAEPVLVQDRPGAMSRLIDQRLHGGTPTGTPQRA